jgi:predicted nucleic acid-binding protein
MGTIVCNAGPLIALAGVGKLSLLERVYSRVLIPEAVYEELTGARRFAQQSELFQLPWLGRRKVEAMSESLLRAELGRGETETIALACQTKADRVLMDERKGRRIAQLVYGLNVTGTGGVLLAAKEAGLIKEIRPIMEQMRSHGYYLSKRLVEGICLAAGE